MAEACRPPLTTIDTNLTELGRYAGQQLLAAIAGEGSSGVHVRPCRLTIRRSTG